MLTSIQLDTRYDPALIKATTPILGSDAWGVGPGTDAGAQTIIFDEGRTTEVMAAIDGYDAHVLARAKIAHIETVAANRRAAVIGNFSFNGMTIRLDESAENALNKALNGLQRLPAGTTVDWEVSRGQFATFDLVVIGAISDAAFAHVQACFSNAKRLTDLVLAAGDLDELAEIDLGNGWA